jgi:hypothetical protein
MPLKLALCWLGSFLINVGYEVLYHLYLARRQPSEPIRFISQVVVMLSGIFYYTASAFWGAFGAMYLFPPITVMQGRITAAVGILAGIWILGIFLQVTLNIARRMIGAETMKLVFFNRNVLSFLRRKRD